MRHPILFLIAIGFLVVAIVPLMLALMAAVGFLLPWLFVGFVFWAVVGPHRRSKRRRLSRWQSPTETFPSARSAWQVQPFVPRSAPSVKLTQPDQPAQPELPIDVQVKVDQIRRKVEMLLAFASRFPPFSKDLYLVRQTATEYLPRTIDAYLALPAGSADQVVPALGLTADQELRQQLDLLDQKLDEIANDLQRQDYDRLLANRRFLEERFGRPRA